MNERPTFDLRAYSGLWIATAREQVVATGRTARQALDAARFQRLKDDVTLRWVKPTVLEMKTLPKSRGDRLEQLRGFLAARDPQAYLVGGTVRDMLQSRETTDIDVAVNINASELAREFADSIGAAYYVMDAEHDVARVICSDGGFRQHVDFARLRGDGIGVDLSTRDFTINAMAADAVSWRGDPSQIIDPFGGRADTQALRLRLVSDSVFLDDPVRLLRAIRFEATLGFALDERAVMQIRRDTAHLSEVTQERVRDEFMQIIASDDALRQLRRMDSLGMLVVVLPELEPLRGMDQSSPHIHDVLFHSFSAVAAMESLERNQFLNLAGGKYAEPLKARYGETISDVRTRGVLLRLVLLLHDIGKPACRTKGVEGRNHFHKHEVVGATMTESILKRLRFSKDEGNWATNIVRHHLRPILLAIEPKVTDRAVYRYFRATGDSGIDVAVHSWCDQSATYGPGWENGPRAQFEKILTRLLDAYYNAHDKIVDPPPLLNGKELQSDFGLDSGPLIGQILGSVREAQASGEIANRNEAMDLVKKLLDERSVRDGLARDG